MNHELMHQCRREAEEAWEDNRLRDIHFIHPATTFKQGYAAALYAERSKRRELTDEASHYLFMGWLHANHADINDNADVSDLCRRAFLDALRYARDNGHLCNCKKQ